MSKLRKSCGSYYSNGSVSIAFNIHSDEYCILLNFSCSCKIWMGLTVFSAY